jgi:hypothetical protein
MFVPVDGGRPATGRTDAHGRFELSTIDPGDGTAAGEYTVTITACESLVQEDEAGPVTDEDYENKQIRWIAPQRYSRAKTSGLTADVGRKNHDFLFELETAESGKPRAESPKEERLGRRGKRFGDRSQVAGVSHETRDDPITGTRATLPNYSSNLSTAYFSPQFAYSAWLPFVGAVRAARIWGKAGRAAGPMPTSEMAALRRIRGSLFASPSVKTGTAQSARPR